MQFNPPEKLTRVVIVTNIPAPYRLPIYQRLAILLGHENFHVVYCANKEKNRHWQLEVEGFAHTFLRSFMITWKNRYIHINPSIVKVLIKLNPDVVITTGFNPSHLLAFAYAVFNNKKHIVMTDGTLSSELILSKVHRIIRRYVFKYSQAFIGASDGSITLFKSYGINDNVLFFSHLCANNEAFTTRISAQRPFDFMFCSRFSAEKNPQFALDVAAGVAKNVGRKISILMVGSGPLLDEIKAYAANLESELEITFNGFVQQGDLPDLYCSAKIFLFPSAWDPWGVVANEACAAGQAILVSPLAGVAGEIVIDNKNGYVLPLELPLWIKQATELLDNKLKCEQFSEFSQNHIKHYNYDEAVQGIVQAISATIRQDPPSNREVVIVQRRLTDYRVPLFESLRKQLLEYHIKLRLLYSDPCDAEFSKHDQGTIIWAEKISAYYLLNNLLCWQPFFSNLNKTDLVIITQENKLICNLWPLFGWRPYKLAFWGHGKNMQASKLQFISEKFKTITTSQVDWWFAYTELSKQFVIEQGFPSANITNLENSVDTSVLKLDFDSIKDSEVNALKVELNLGKGPIGLYVGSLYREKKLDFLIGAGVELVDRLPDFRLIIIGDGPLKNQIVEAAKRYSWLHYVGRKTAREKALFLKLANVVLNPGLVGLGILDAFTAGVPLITTDCKLHSPEISYLKEGVNGYITENNLPAFVEQVTLVLTDPELAKQLNEGCLESSVHYTLENMTHNFVQGIFQAMK